jgi:hypothetical protein
LPNANHISNYLNNEIINLAKQCKKIKSTPIVRGDSAYEKLFEEFIDVNRNDDKVKAMSNIRTTFRNLRDITNDEKIIDVSGESLTDVITSDKPTVLLFSLDTKAKKIQSAQVARMLIADLKQNDRVIKENDENNNLMCIFDEFGSFATEDIVELQEQGRSFGFQIIYSIQTLSNLTKISLDFATRIVGNCSTYITHRTRDNKAAEEIANLISTNPSLEATERHSEGEATGEQSVREVQEYIHHPRLIKQLSDHYALIVTVKEGVVTPIKEPIKIDYADVEHFHADDNKEASEYELELSKCFEEEGFSKVKAQKLTKENINQNIQFVSKKGKDVLIAKVYKSSVDDEINKIESMSEKEWDKYREIL